MSPEFVAALIEGFEGTLNEVLDRLPDGELWQEMKALQEHLCRLRHSLQTYCIRATPQ